MPQSLTIPQPLAAELGLPAAKGAPPGATFSLGQLLDHQENILQKLRQRRKKNATNNPPRNPF